MGMSAALREQVRIEHGRAMNTNFDQYRLARISDAPERIDTIIIESGQTMGGVGEPLHLAPGAVPQLEQQVQARHPRGRGEQVAHGHEALVGGEPRQRHEPKPARAAHPTHAAQPRARAPHDA